MLTRDEIRLKAASLDSVAAKAGDACAAAYREMAMQWRLFEVETAFMEAMRAAIPAEIDPLP